MKSDKDIFKEFRERNRSTRLFTEEQVLSFMDKARTEVLRDTKNRIPKIEQLQDEFKVELSKTKNDPGMAACYSRLTQDKTAWVWFTQGAAAVLKRFK